MKTNTDSVNKMIKSFDKELRSILLNDLKIVRVADKAIAPKISHIGVDEEQLSEA